MKSLLNTSLSLAAVSAVCVITSSYADESSVDLEDVVVQYNPAYRGTVSDHEKPQAIESVDKQTISEAGITDFQSVLELSASVSQANNMGGLWDTFSVRGFPGSENMPSGYLINGFSAGRGYSGRRDVSSIDYVEVIKGPGSALYGRSEPGGTVNVVTLKPEYYTHGSVSAEVGSYDYQSLTGDITGKIADGIAGRINGNWQDSDSFRDHIYQKKQTLNPSLLFDLSDNTSLLYEMEYVKQRQPFDRGIVVLNNDFDTVHHDRFLGEPDDGPITTKVWGHQFTLEHTFDNDWMFIAGLSQRYSSLEGYSTEPELAASRQTLYDDGETLTRQRRYRDYKAFDRSARAEISGSSELAGITHHIMLGADTYRYFLDNVLMRYRGGYDTYTLNIDDPQYGQPLPDVSDFTDTHEYQQAWGVYLQDQVEVTEALQVQFGARVDNYHRSQNHGNFESGSEVSPRLGITYALNSSVQLYTSYSEGFMPLSGTDVNGDPFDPEDSRSTEIGAKVRAGSWTGQFVVFDAYKSNILTSDPVNAGYSAQLGEVRSTGAEIDAQGNLTDTATMRISYSWLDTRTTKDIIDAEWGTDIPQGSDLVNVPENTLNVGLKQMFFMSAREAYIGLNYLYVDDRLGDTITPSYRLPSYWLLNLSAGVDVAENVSARLVVNNLLNKFYVANSYNELWTQPGQPRMIKASLRYDF